MKTEHFNQLTEAEQERLVRYMEECAEVIQIGAKILRHGFESTHPDGGPTNRELLEMESGHVMSSLRSMIGFCDLASYRIIVAESAKDASVGKYLHHN